MSMRLHLSTPVIINYTVYIHLSLSTVQCTLIRQCGDNKVSSRSRLLASLLRISVTLK